MDATGIGLDAWVDTSSSPVQLSVRLHGATLPVEPSGDSYACRFRIVFVQQEVDGSQVNGTQDVVDMKLTRAALRLALETGFEYRKGLTLAPATATLRIAVRSDINGAVGALRLPIRQP